MTNSFRYADLLHLLEGLGFACREVNGSLQVCEHKPSETLIVLADRPDDDVVREQVLVGVRLQLEVRGLLGPGDFDRRVALVTSEENGTGVGQEETARKSGTTQTPAYHAPGGA